MKTKCKHVKILMTRKLIKSNELNKPGTGEKPKYNRGKATPPPETALTVSIKEGGGCCGGRRRIKKKKNGKKKRKTLRKMINIHIK